LSLTPGHVAGQTYFLPIGFTEAIPSRVVEKDTRQTLSGRQETRHHRSKTQWDFTFQPVRGALLAHLTEFLDSVGYGDRFRIFVYDDVHSDELIRTDAGHSWQPFMRTGSRYKDWFQASVITGREP
jgi:hypothetical protein